MRRLLLGILFLATRAAPPATPPSPPASRPVTTSASKPASQPTTIPAAFAGPAGGFPQKPPTGALNRVPLAGLKNDRAWFHLAVPPNYSPDQAWPLMVVLHGGPGGGPDDVVSFFRGGLTAKGVINVYPNALDDRLLTWNYPHSGAYLLAIIRQVAQTYRVDPCRIYLVGVSMGGGGTWANGAVMPQVWAGLGPIAGWYQPNPPPPAAGLKGRYIYCLHGALDAAVPAARSRIALAEMKALGHRVLEVTDLAKFDKIGDETMVYREVPNGQHNVLLPWPTQGKFELGKMIGWLLAHRRATPADLPAAEKSLAEWGKQFQWTPGGGGAGREECWGDTSRRS